MQVTYNPGNCQGILHKKAPIEMIGRILQKLWSADEEVGDVRTDERFVALLRQIRG